MFTDNLPFAPFITLHLEVMKFVMNIVVIMLIIVALANGGVSGSGTYTALVLATMVGIVEVIIGKLYKPKEAMA